MSVTDLNQLRWRCRRGMREMDILLGDFLESEYSSLTPAIQNSFRALLDEFDQDILDWIMQRREAPDQYTELITLLREYRRT